ncbi:desulfoferrodoxin [Geotalea daltonii FRC-32]|uniref:Desulfoferrodoxin n=1 Tax=Geotalea daltonii (strain DSM 22248 / JCM 15807 / FRC-32) TaxID=316067 RepID=B9M4V5_GEODF|nr:desulfoferrodoxin [Geotalea daltonii]ACM21639.1 desulfoferrodoxin [Geotalea daltonii FRC-32]
MSKKLEIYKCQSCGNIIEVFHAGAGELVCCGSPMALQVENTVDASREKHLPVVEKNAGGITVKVGSIPHPMEEQHFIEWIEVVADGRIFRQELKPGDVPQAVFPAGSGKVVVREYCSLHGQWATNE